VRPEGPVFTRLSLSGGGFAYEDVFYSRHKEVSFPKLLFPGIVDWKRRNVNCSDKFF
jgi:hypothetical protein